MARLGGNDRKVHLPLSAERITAAVVTFLPDEVGYFQARLDAIRLSLTSLVKHADLPLDLLVFDNASCRKLTDYLHELKDAGVIRFLILSAENVGLSGAYPIVARAAPGEIVALANDDVFYFPNWLSPQVQVLDSLPDAGLVSGAYLRGTHPRIARLALEKGLRVETVPAPDEWLEEFCRDASYPSPEAYMRGQEWQGWTDRDDRMISLGGVRCYAGGVCWQAVFRKETLRELVPTDDHTDHGFPGFDGYFHAEIVRRGYLRASTTERLVRHIGNVITPEMAALAARFGIEARVVIPLARNGDGHPLMRSRVSRAVVTRLHNYLYRVVKR